MGVGGGGGVGALSQRSSVYRCTTMSLQSTKVFVIYNISLYMLI